MTPLRSSCIEAMAGQIAHHNGGPVDDRIIATAALDALLSTLTEHADQWDALLRWDLRNTELPEALIAVLKAPELPGGQVG